MNCIYSIAAIENINDLVNLRIDFIKEIHPEFSLERLDQIAVGSRDYITKKYENGSYCGFLGTLSGTIVCFAGLLIYDLPLLQSSNVRKVGHVLNFYTKPEYRKKGIGQGLMEYIINHSRSSGFTRLVLNATTDGYELYKKTGFTDSDKSMVIEYN